MTQMLKATRRVARPTARPTARGAPTIHRGVRLGGHQKTHLTFPDTDRSADSGVVRHVT
jgi:hypothetical protein